MYLDEAKSSSILTLHTPCIASHDDKLEPSATEQLSPRATQDSSDHEGLQMPQHGERDGPGPQRFIAPHDHRALYGINQIDPYI